MRLPSCETSISPTLVVWSLLMGSGSTSGCGSAVSDVRRQITARSWSARCSVKKYWPAHTFGTPMRSERMRPPRRVRMAGNDGRWASSDWVYLFWASIQARVSGLCWSSSQRYGSTMSTPWRVSWTLSVRVGGGAATFCAAPLAAWALDVASARARRHDIVRANLIEGVILIPPSRRRYRRNMVVHSKPQPRPGSRVGLTRHGGFLPRSPGPRGARRVGRRGDHRGVLVRPLARDDLRRRAAEAIQRAPGCVRQPRNAGRRGHAT